MAQAPEPTVLVADRVHLPAASEGVEAVRVRAGRIEAVGARSDVGAGARILEFPDATIAPGLTDAHVHLVEWALNRGRVSLLDATTLEEVSGAVGAAAGAVGTWVQGHGWSRHRLSEPPHRRVLDVVDRPVALLSEDMHAVWANTPALERAGVGAETPDPEGGRIERDADGEPTGVLLDNAMALVLDRIPAPTEAERRAAVLDGQAALHRAGITGVHTVEPDSLGLLEELRAGNVLQLRVLQHLPLARLDDAIRLRLRSGFGDDWLRIGGVKMFLDGSLGSLTAWLLEPYEETADRGVQTLPDDVFRDAVRRGAAAGLASTVHAIGDAAVALALDVLAEAERVAVPHRIEHVQLVPPERAADAGRSGIVCSVQPSHILADWATADRHWGGRAARAYAFRSLLEGGAVLAFGSDMPAGPMDPRLGFLAATARHDVDGRPEGGWYAAEALDAATALEAYTAGPAHAAGRRDQGRIAVGAVADLVVWDRDPLAMTGGEFLDLRCLGTMVDGAWVWREEA